MNIQIIFYSMYGHIYQMAEAVVGGVERVEGAEANLYQVEELMPDDLLESTGAKDARQEFEDIPFITPDILREGDATIYGTPTRYGNMCSQMRNFMDQLNPLWLEGVLEGRVGSVFTSSATQHGGQETTITSFHSTLIHLGYLVAGVPYSEQRLTNMDEISGGSPYGASTLAGADGSRQPSEDELEIARTQGQRVAEITRQLMSD
jgi:NAD(P)H dehydrogenase (quinone)